MFTPKEKIKVFISSICGEDRYDLVRQGLKSLIESTQLADVYLFEDEGASTASARIHYLHYLREADICIFLIDNQDGVRQGVQEEIDLAKKYNIKSLYYFCNEQSKEKTATQQGLMGAEFAKSKDISSFKDFIDSGAKDLVVDLIMVYKRYSKGYIYSNDDESVPSKSTATTLPSLYKYDSTNEEIFKELGETECYFGKLLTGQVFEVKQSNKYDAITVKVLESLFEHTALNAEDWNTLKEAIAENRPAQYTEVINCRVDAVAAYFSGNLDVCIQLLESALKLAKKVDLPEWIVNDILIDLRNVSIWSNESKNEWQLQVPYQAELDMRKGMLLYPELDRVYSDLYELIAKDSIKAKSDSPYSIQLGSNLEKYTKKFAQSLLIILLNGSITHLFLVYKPVKAYAMLFAEKYNAWNLKMLVLKTTVIDYNKKEIEGTLRVFDDLTYGLNAREAFELYDFCNNKMISYQRFIAQLETFKIVAYVLDDSDFRDIWIDLKREIMQWFNTERPVMAVGSHIFGALSSAYHRLPQNEVMEIVVKCFERNFARFYEEIFEMLRININIETLDQELLTSVVQYIMEIVRDSEKNTKYNSLGKLLVRLGKQDSHIVADFEKTIQTHMRKFYEEIYCLELLDKSGDATQYILSEITSIDARNKKQGKNHAFLMFSSRPFDTIRNIIRNGERDYSDELLDTIFQKCYETLVEKEQSLDEKIEAIQLMIFLNGKYPSVATRKTMEIQALIANEELISTGSNIMSNLSQTALEFNVLLLYTTFNQYRTADIIAKLADMSNDIVATDTAASTCLNILASGIKIDAMLNSIILQNAVMWSKSSNADIRWEATELLFALLNNQEYKDVITTQLIRLIDSDNAYIKNRILRRIEQLKEMDDAVYKYILERGKTDPNYIVRKVAQEVAAENT